MNILSEFDDLRYIRNFPEKEVKLLSLYSKIQKFRLNKDFKLTTNTPKDNFLILTPSFLKIAYTKRIRTLKDLILKNPFSSLIIFEDNGVNVMIVKNKKIDLGNAIATILPVYFGNVLLKVYYLEIPIIHGFNNKVKLEIIMGREVSLIVDDFKFPFIIIRSQVELEKLLERPSESNYL